MGSDFYFGLSAGILIGTVIMGLTFIGINSNRILLNEDDWNCSQSRILDPKNVDRVTCIRYKKVIKDEIGG